VNRSSKTLGARRLQLADWPFGAVSRRLLLDALLREPQPPDGWKVMELEDHAGVENGGLAGVLPGAIDLSLAEYRDGRIHRSDAAPDLSDVLISLLNTADGLPKRTPRPIPRRPYVRRR
jgi:hypothetical protein